MKKKIGFEQLVELNENQKEQLLQWWNARNDSTEVPLLTIGDMIELLFDYNFNESCLNLYIEKEKALSSVKGNNNDNSIDLQGYQAQELCDALWEAVKTVMND